METLIINTLPTITLLQKDKVTNNSLTSSIGMCTEIVKESFHHFYSNNSSNNISISENNSKLEIDNNDLAERELILSAVNGLLNLHTQQINLDDFKTILKNDHNKKRLYHEFISSNSNNENVEKKY